MSRKKYRFVKLRVSKEVIVPEKNSDLALRTIVVFAIYYGENCPNIDSEHFSSSRSLRAAECTYESAYHSYNPIWIQCKDGNIFLSNADSLGRSKCLELSAVNRPHMDDLGLKQKCRGYLHTDLRC